jgi:hypothetical protein
LELNVSAMADELVERTCAVCGVFDTEPMHVQASVSDPGADSVSKHVRCCDCGICVADTERADAEGLDVWAQMREFLTNRPRDHRQYLFEQFAVESPDFQSPG